MMKVYPTVRTTRRGNLSWVFDERDQPIYSVEDLSTLLDWLADEGYAKVLIHGHLTEWELTLKGVFKHEEPEPTGED